MVDTKYFLDTISKFKGEINKILKLKEICIIKIKLSRIKHF